MEVITNGAPAVLCKHTLSEETKRKMSETRKRLYAEGKTKAGKDIWRNGVHPKGSLGKTAWNKGLTKSDPRVAKYAHFAGEKNPMYGKHPIPWNKGKKGISEEYSKHLSESSYSRGRKPWNAGLPKQLQPWFGRTHSEATKKHLSEIRMGKFHSAESKQLMSEVHKIQWQDPIFREKNIKAALKSLLKWPTSLDRHFMCLIAEYNLPFRFVGDGDILIGRKNPDFCEINGKKICIEVRSKEVTTHLGKMSVEEYKQSRINYFDKYGWTCLVFIADRTNKRNWVFEEPEEKIVEQIKECCAKKVFA